MNPVVKMDAEDLDCVETPDSIENNMSDVEREIAKEFNLRGDVPARLQIAQMILAGELSSANRLIERWLELYSWCVEFCQDETPKRDEETYEQMDGAAEAALSFSGWFWSTTASRAWRFTRKWKSIGSVFIRA